MLLIAVVATVLGTFAMHALSPHGTSHPPVPDIMPGTTTGVMAHDAMSTGPHITHHDAVMTPDRATPPSPSAQGDSPDGMGAMGMLCVAMLTAAAGALLLVLLPRRRPPWLWAVLPLTRTALLRPFTVPPAGAGPPPVWEFSAIRC